MVAKRRVQPKTFVCSQPSCTGAFTSKRSLQEHHKKCHATALVRDQLACFKCKTKDVVQNKQRTAGIDSARCPQCNIYWCLVGACTKEITKQCNLTKHQNMFHNKNFADKCTFCTGPKNRAAGLTQDQCPDATCRAHWCLVEGCSYDEKDVGRFNQHQSRYHHELLVAKAGDGDLNTCECGTAKTGAGRSAQCPNNQCNKYWCLVDQCGRTFATLKSINSHVSKLHK